MELGQTILSKPFPTTHLFLPHREPSLWGDLHTSQWTHVINYAAITDCDVTREKEKEMKEKKKKKKKKAKRVVIPFIRLSLTDLIDWLVGCLTSQQHASVFQGRICSDNCTCCHTETEVAESVTEQVYTKALDISHGAWYSPCALHPVPQQTSSTTMHGRRTPCWGRSSSADSVLGSLSCWMQRRGFDPPLGRIFPVEIFPLEFTWVLTPFPPKLFRMRV